LAKVEIKEGTKLLEQLRQEQTTIQMERARQALQALELEIPPRSQSFEEISVS
jgi:hypothetical protein